MLQDNNASDTEPPEQSESEKETLESKKEHEKSYFWLMDPPINSYSSTQILDIDQPEGTGLWGETEYMVYLAFEDFYSPDSSTYYSEVVPYGPFFTGDLPPDRYTSVNV